MKNSFADRVRVAAGKHPTGFSPDDIARDLNLKTNADLKRLAVTLNIGLKRGKYVRVAHGGDYCLAENRSRPQKRESMWRWIRKEEKPVSVRDLVEICGVCPKYAREFLQGMAKGGYLVRLYDGRYRLVNDSFECPENAQKLARIKKHKADKKQRALEALADADRAISVARAAIMED